MEDLPEIIRRQALIREKLRKRAKIIHAIRSYFLDHEYLEVETPYRVPTIPPEAHIDAPQSGNWFLHTSPEIFMKRLLASGYSRIFQVCHCFREGERGSEHLPEFTMLEWYKTDTDYLGLMDECEELIRSVVHTIVKSYFVSWQDNKIDFRKPWEKISVREAFKKYSSVSMDETLKNDMFDEVMVLEIEPHLNKLRPVFLYDYPASRGSLARLKHKEQDLAERFELYIGGMELANAFSELTDSNEQRKRFEQANEARIMQSKLAYPIPDKFLAALPFMPESAGIAFGIDRFVMLLTDSKDIDEVVAFLPDEC